MYEVRDGKVYHSALDSPVWDGDPDEVANLFTVRDSFRQRAHELRIENEHLRRFQAAANDALSLLCEGHIDAATEKALEALNMVHEEASDV